MLYPLHFKPLYKQYLWGGRKFVTSLGKTLPPGDCYAESWEICDHGSDQSVAAWGPLAGKTLAALLVEHGRELLGRHHPRRQFPLLFKFLDVAHTTSVQVHPNDIQAAALNPPDSGKTEAWVILEAEPESMIYAGLKPGVNRGDLEAALREGRCQDCLHAFRPQVGDCIYLPAGTVHALGAGLLAAEIQQPSDTTFRLFDWNRLDRDGKPRPLQIQQALNVINFQSGPINPQQPQTGSRIRAKRLVAGEKFVLDQYFLDAIYEIGGDDRFHILIIIEGSLRIEGDPAPGPMSRGGVALLPAALGKIRLAPQKKAVILDAFLPD